MTDDVPLLTRPDEPIPTVLPVVRAPRPGLAAATGLTVGFAAVLFGSIVVLILVAVVYFLLTGQGDVLSPAADAAPGSAAALSPALTGVLTWSFPFGYFVGLVYAVLVLRVVVGRGWTREVGLRRLPPAQLALGLLALPAFMILSDGLAKLLFWTFGMEHMLDQSNQLGELFRGCHPAFVLLAIGIGPGVVEELWCRGFLGRGLVARYGWVEGVALASMFFGLLHLFPPPYVLVTAVMGVGLHFIYATSRSLWVPMILHAANNGFAGLAAVGAVPTGGMDRAVETYPAVVYSLAVVLLVSCGWAAWTGRSVAAGPRGIAVPPGGVTDRRPRAVPALLTLTAAAGMYALFALS